MKALPSAAALGLFGVVLGSSPASPDCTDYGNYLHWLGCVDTTGTSWSNLAAAGSYAYVASGGFLIVEFSDPQSPHVVSSLNLAATDVAISGRYAYVADSDDRLDIVDISDPNTPFVVGQVTLPSHPKGIAVSGAYAYVTCLWPGLEVIDVTDPGNPKIVGSVNTLGQARQVAVSGSHAYIANEDMGLWVIDISDPHNPFVVSTLRTPGFAYDVAVSEGYAYVAETNHDQAVFSGLQVIDVADPARPRPVASVEMPDWAVGVAISGTTAYVANSGGGFKAIDIADPLTPKIVGEVWTGGTYDVAISGKVACVATSGTYAVHLIDVTSSENAPIVGSVDTPDQAYGLAISGTFAYIADRTSGLQVVDFSDPGNPLIVASADLFWSLGVAVSSPYAYVTTGYGTRRLAIVDISNPLDPHEIGSVVMLGWSFGVAVSGNYAYVADGDAGMTVVDISNPHAPVVVAGVSTPGYARAMAVSGDYAYVGAAGLQVVDIEDPLDPRIVGCTDTGADGIAVLGTYAYAATSQGLQIIDVANPEKPVIVSTVCTPASATGVAVSEGYAYVGSCRVTGSGAIDKGVFVIDISDPYDPRILGCFAAGGSVLVTDEYVCVASPAGSSGFHVAWLQCGPAGAVQMVDPRSSLRLQVFPNPFLWETTLRLQLPAEEYVHATVVDVAGRRVRILLDGIHGSCDRDLHWDGRDDEGRDVAPGVYLIRTQTSREIRSSRVVLLR